MFSPKSINNRLSTCVGMLATLVLGASPAAAQCDPEIMGTVFTGGWYTESLGIAVSDNVAYVTQNGLSSLRIIDVSDPATPVSLGVVGMPGDATGVAVSGPLAYVADGTEGLQVIDVSDPSNPWIIGSVDTPGFARGIAISGTLACVADSASGLQLIDVSDPSNPTIIGSIDTPGPAMAIAVSGPLAYVANGTNGLQVIDVSDPTNPTILGSVAMSSYAVGVFASGSLVYLADWSSLRAIDVSDPTNPTILGTVATSATGVVVSGTRAYVAAGYEGLQVIDVSDPTNMTIVGNVTTMVREGIWLVQGEVKAVAVAGSMAYISSWGEISQIDVIDIESCITFGACCVNNMCLELMTADNCLALGGTFLGPDSTCSDGSCSTDTCSNAVTITEGDTAFSTIGATTDGPPLPPGCDEGFGLLLENDTWFRYLAPRSGTLTVSTCDQADFDTRLAAYAGGCSSLTLIACNDDGPACFRSSVMEVPVTAGEEILIRVGGSGPAEGTGTLTLSLPSCDADNSGPAGVPDGMVGIEDFLRVLSEWGECLP